MLPSNSTTNDKLAKCMSKIKNYIELLRINHWFKNIVTLLGSFYALYQIKAEVQLSTLLLATIAFLLTCLLSSVNYIINQIVDVPTDLHHPVKKNRPLPCGIIPVRQAKFITVSLLVFTTTISLLFLNFTVILCLSSFLVAGMIYNIKPIRLKDISILDVISESVNNPIRFLIGWFAISVSYYPSFLLLLTLWSSGAVLMSYKRLRELKSLDTTIAQKYRLSFKFYTPRRLLMISIFWVFITIALLCVYAYQQ